MFFYRIFSLILFVSFFLDVFPQKELREIQVPKINSEINIDGKLDEAAWQKSQVLENFRQKYPYDTALAEIRTRVRILYDDKNLYIAAKCIKGEKDGFIVSSLRRDFDGNENDAFYVILNPFCDETSGLLFGINPYGVQREGLIMNGGGGHNGKNDSWDNKWYAEVKRNENDWTVEIAIPFKTIRFREGSREWKANFARIDFKNNEYSNWNWLPRNQSSSSLAYTGRVIFEKPLKNPGANISVIPYISGGISRDYEEDLNRNRIFDAGGDVKIALSSSLNLDLTVNPDFSQVEVDKQVMNLDRFEIFFPEKRQFFLENSDLFSEFGTHSLRPFFSRRIGIASDTSTGTTIENPIWLGARVSGKINKDWRIGLMDVQASNEHEQSMAASNYAIATLHRRLFSRSSLSGIFVNKQCVGAFGNPEDTIGLDHYNRIAGLDLNLASKDNLFTGKVFYHRSFDSEVPEGSFAHGAQLEYNHPNLELSWSHEWVGEDYMADVGFIRRTGYKMINPNIGYTIYPGLEKVNRMAFYIYNKTFWQNDYGMTDQMWMLRYYLRLSNQSIFILSYGNDYIKLTSPYDPSGTEVTELPENSEYQYSYFYGYFRSDPRKAFNTHMEIKSGGYFNGTGTTITGESAYRFQPFGSLGIDYTYSRIRLPEPYARADLLLIGPKIDITFTRNIFFSTLVQYNNQIDNLNINARFQWRYKPVSDFYLVYTDNYYATSFKEKNRAIVFKITYWLNV